MLYYITQHDTCYIKNETRYITYHDTTYIT